MRFAPMSVKSWLVLIVSLALLPPLIFSIVLLNLNDKAQEEIVSTLAESTVGANADGIDSHVAGMVTTMRALALSDNLRHGNLARFHEEASRALADTETYVIVVDRDMNQLLNTRQPYGAPLGKTADPEPLQQAIQSGEPVISDGFYGNTAKQWVFNVAIPLSGRFGNAAVLIMTENADSLGATLRMERMRGGWNAAIVDGNNIVLASTFMSSDIGKPFFLAPSADVAADEPPREIVSANGKKYRLRTELSQLTGWTVNLWAEEATVRAPARETFRTLLLGGLILMSVSLIAAWLAGRELSRSVRGLADDAHRIGKGEAIKPHTFPVDELTTVSSALADAAKSRKTAENEIRFLMREVAHRSKNQLTVISSLAKQTATGSDSVEEFSETFGQRILGLARSTDLLVAGSASGVEMGALIRVQVEPFRPADDAALIIEGPEFRMSAQAAQTVGLAIHELATNAAKYGALSVSDGKLKVSWAIKDEMLVLNWREELPHEIEPPTRKGFGTRLITRTLSGALGAEIEIDYGKHGVTYVIAFPVAKLVEGSAVDRENAARLKG